VEDNRDRGVGHDRGLGCCLKGSWLIALFAIGLRKASPGWHVLVRTEESKRQSDRDGEEVPEDREYVRTRMLQKQIEAKPYRLTESLGWWIEECEINYTGALGRMDLGMLSIVDIGNWPVGGTRDGADPGLVASGVLVDRGKDMSNGISQARRFDASIERRAGGTMRKTEGQT